MDFNLRSGASKYSQFTSTSKNLLPVRNAATSGSLRVRPREQAAITYS